MNITQSIAKQIIMKLGQSGEPPEIGASYFSVGLDSYLKAIEEEYLDGILKDGLSAFKLIIGDYGAGKTHFLYCLREKAWEKGYVVTLVSLNPRDCPFDKLELVYREMVSKLTVKPKDNSLLDLSNFGLKILIEDWCENVLSGLKKIQKESESNLEDLVKRYLSGIKSIESASYMQALKSYFLSYMKENYDNMETLQRWLYGEAIPKYLMYPLKIYDKLDRTTAFRMIRSLCQFVREIGYKGLVILFDEGERQTSIAGSKSRKMAFDNLRQIIDECGNSRLPGSFFCYAVPPSFLDQAKTYVALSQRLSSGINFSFSNPSGVIIDLENLDLSGEELLIEIGKKLWSIFKIAYPNDVADLLAHRNISILAEEVYQQTLDVSQRRIFIKAVIESFQVLRTNPNPMTSTETRQLVKSSVQNLRLIETKKKQEEFIADIEGEDFDEDE